MSEIQSAPAAAIGVNVQHVYKTYVLGAEKIQALRDVNLTLKQGTVVALLGKSGAGKSTLLHVIGTLDRPTQGRVLLNGINVSTMGDTQASSFRNFSIGFVFQMNNLLAEFTALENVMIPGMISGTKRSLVRDRAMEVLKAVGLEHRQKHRPGELSGGEQQRVAIARALLMSPPLLLADEPTGNLDQKTSRAIQDLLLALCEEHNLTMVLVTHDLELAKRLPHQIVMEDGQIIDRGSL